MCYHIMGESTIKTCQNNIIVWNMIVTRANIYSDLELVFKQHTWYMIFSTHLKRPDSGLLVNKTATLIYVLFSKYRDGFALDPPPDANMAI
ncbi:MAG: hypothetical protein IPL63_14485 [Saprospiraceae bacterium]|nr:hypothetical protein [Saprospiraceae bacterium]